MKKVLVLFVILLTMFFFAACAGDEDEDSSENSGNSSENGSSGNENGSSEEKEDGENERPDTDEEPTDGGGIYVSCTPGETMPCYEGPSGTQDVGICKSGVATCVEDGSDWSECVGQVLPDVEICGNGIDENCDGEDMTPENAVDYDGDGFNYCTGDCCETGWESGCFGTDSPERINPDAYEMENDSLDNNCNGQVDEPEAKCDDGLVLAVGDYEGNAVKLAQALGVCTGLISAELSLAGEPVTEQIDTNPEPCKTENGTTSCNYNPQPRPSREKPYYESDYQTFAVENNFGGIMPTDGSAKIAILSTGPWNDPTMNAQVATLAAGDMQTASKLPEDWLNMMPECAAPKAPSCGGTVPQNGLTNQCAGKEIPVGQDPIMLTLKIKAPVNAEAFEFNLFFMSIEYPQTVCKDFNDFFIALLDSTYNEKNPGAEYMNPYDKNLAKDEFGNPVGVDLAPAGLFKACRPDCNNGVNKWHSCVDETELIGTGFEAGNGLAMVACTSGHGGTGWLRVAGNIVPNEEFTLRFALWEQGEVSYGPDHSYDSTIVLDGFKWLPRPGKPGVTPK